MKISTKKLVYISILTTLAIILTRVFSIRIPFMGVEGIRIGFGALPIIFAGVALGPVAGGLVGAISDLLGFFINPMGAYMPHFTLTSMLTGLLPGVMICYLFRGKINFKTLIVTVGITQIITAIIMVPYFMNSLFGIPFTVSLPPRIISQAFSIPLYAYFTNVLLSYDLIKGIDRCSLAKN